MTRSRSAFDVVFYVPTVSALLVADPQAPAGGAETQVRLVAAALAGQGVRTALVAFDHPDLPTQDGAVTVIRRAPHAANAAVEAGRIAAALRRAPSRVIVTRQAGAHAGIAALVARGSGRRFVYSAANVIDFDFTAHEAHRWKRLLFALALRLADQIVAQTDEQRVLCRQRLDRDAPVIRSVAEPAEPRTGPGRAFLWAGRVVDYKQPLAFLDLAAAVPEARFYMVAVPDDGLDPGRRLFDVVQARAARLDNVQLLPSCTRAELLVRTAQAVAVVSTSTTEGMPNVWLEAWSRGVPALTLNHDPDQLVSERGLGHAAQGDPARFAAVTRELWAQRDSLQSLGRHCREYAMSEHGPDAVGARWRTVLGLAS